MRISVEEEGTRFLVESDSGATYHIKYAGSSDADPEYVGLWECNCPAGKHGRDCKHICAFLASRLMDVDDPEYCQDELPTSIEV